MVSTTQSVDKQTSSSAQRRSLVAAGVGNALEWFDWNLYAIFSVYLAHNAFQSDNPTSALLSTLAIFAVGFVARPVGGFVFGRLSDKIGRKNVMVATMCLLAGSSVAMAALPTYAAVGIGASAFLLIVRLVQGLAHGGEAGVSYTYAAEIAPPARRGLWSSMPFVASTIGLMAATSSAAVLTGIFDADQMDSYGWRIGFAFGGLLGLFALWIRRTAIETEVFLEEAETVEESDTPATKMSGREILGIALRIIMISVGTNISFYAWVSFAPTNAISQHDMHPTSAFVVSLLSQGLIVLLLPFMGALSDKVGRKPFVFAQGALMIALAFPIAGMVSSAPWTLFVALMLGQLVWACAGAIYPAIVAEQAPTRIRATIVGLVVSLSVAIFGGTAPYLNTWLTSTGKSSLFSVYIMVLGAVVVAGSILIKETKGIDLRDLDQPANK
ncbi:MFS transporter [Rhodococcus sp. LB1]|uniref:MFS transporter n=1 Tax=Rhodococcus sp. LB1 TaxID=1807499 RepID=UPI0005C24BD7|nr:MFS transporter [Rhodococcus sp. LB1]KXX61596.1 MFS transporter [Rhodococcus sp. LB1]RYF59907.1 MAG: MFS transporter [Comamonadaceae bacterium]